MGATNQKVAKKLNHKDYQYLIKVTKLTKFGKKVWIKMIWIKKYF